MVTFTVGTSFFDFFNRYDDFMLVPANIARNVSSLAKIIRKLGTEALQTYFTYMGLGKSACWKNCIVFDRTKTKPRSLEIIKKIKHSKIIILPVLNPWFCCSQTKSSFRMMTQPRSK